MANKVVLRDVFSVMRNPEFIQVVGEPSGDNVVGVELKYPITYGQDVRWAQREYDTRCALEGPSSTQYFAGHIKFVTSLPWSGARQAQHMGDPVRSIGMVVANLSCIEITKDEYELPLEEYVFPIL